MEGNDKYLNLLAYEHEMSWDQSVSLCKNFVLTDLRKFYFYIFRVPHQVLNYNVSIGNTQEKYRSVVESFIRRTDFRASLQLWLFRNDDTIAVWNCLRGCFSYTELCVTSDFRGMRATALLWYKTDSRDQNHKRTIKMFWKII